MAELKVKITDLPDGTPANTDVIPFVDLATNTTKKALKSELKGDKGDAATVNAGTTTTLAAGQNATVTNVGTPSAAIFNFAIPQGIQGIPGATGAKVISVAFSGNDIVFTLDDSSTVTLTNAKIDLKGDKGDKGDNGSDGTNGVDGAVIVSGAFSGDDLVFTLSDSSTATVIGAKTDLRGIQGIPGATGNGISNISLISTVGLVKTYRITYTDSTTFDYTVTDGENGTNGIDGIDGTSFTWKGAYDGGTAYVKNDNVSYNGSSYIAKSNTTGNLPTNSTYWDLLAEKGADGSGAGDMLASVYDADGGAKQVAFKDQLHNAVTVTDTAEIDMTLTGQDIKADIKTASIAKSKLDSSVQTSLGKADSAIQDISGKEDVSNKKTSLADNSDTFYPTQKAVKTAVDAKQDTLAFTPEDSANKENTTIDTSTTKYPTVNLLKTVKDTIPVKATGAEINTGTDDAKFVTPKALAESNLPLHTATWSLVESDKEVAIGTALGGDWRIPGNRAIKIKKVGAYVDTAAATGSDVLTVDINEAGTSILSTKITIDVGDKSSNDATTAPVISDSAIAADAILTFDIDQVNETTPAKGLKVWIEFTY